MIYEAKLQGRTDADIAHELGVDAKDIRAYITARMIKDAAFITAEERKSYLALEVARLNALQAAVWPSAMMNDPKSVDSALKIIQTRAKLQQLDQPDTSGQQAQLLIIGQSQFDYVEQLKELANEDEEPVPDGD